MECRTCRATQRKAQQSEIQLLLIMSLAIKKIKVGFSQGNYIYQNKTSDSELLQTSYDSGLDNSADVIYIAKHELTCNHNTNIMKDSAQKQGSSFCSASNSTAI